MVYHNMYETLFAGLKELTDNRFFEFSTKVQKFEFDQSVFDTIRNTDDINSLYEIIQRQTPRNFDQVPLTTLITIRNKFQQLPNIKTSRYI